jgi:hypothetical protein
VKAARSRAQAKTELFEQARTKPNYLYRDLHNQLYSDATFILGGRSGSADELAHSLELARPTGILLETGGLADASENLIIAIAKAGKPPRAPFVLSKDPVRLARAMMLITDAFVKRGGAAAYHDGAHEQSGNLELVMKLDAPGAEARLAAWLHVDRTSPEGGKLLDWVGLAQD